MATRKNYAEIAAGAIYRPADEISPATKRKPKILAYSKNKKGKSTLAASAGDRVLFADPEWGASKMKSKNPHIWPISQWADMDDFYKFLRMGGKCPRKGCESGEGHPFEWAAIDGMTKLSNMALKHVMRVQEERDLDRVVGMVQQRDYGRAGELMKDMMHQFHNMDLGVIYTAQERQDAPFTGDEDEESEVATASYVPDLPKGVRGQLTSVVDVIGRLYVVKVEGRDGVVKPQRRLWIGPSLQYDTGYRSDYQLPDMVKVPTIPKLVKLMAEGTIK